MSIRKGRFSSTNGLPYGGQQIPRGDAYALMAAEIPRGDAYALMAAEIRAGRTVTGRTPRDPEMQRLPASKAKIDSIPYPSMFVGVDLSSSSNHCSAIAIRQGIEVVMVADSGPAGPNITAAWINGLSARRKPEREALVLAISAIVQVRGGTVTRRDKEPVRGFGGAGIDLSITLNGVGAQIGISDLHGGDFALISWHNTQYPARNFTSTFCASVGETGNGRPHHKATSHPRDWYSLAMSLDAGLYLAARGEAFEPVSQ